MQFHMPCWGGGPRTPVADNFDGGSLNTTKGHKLGKDEPYAKAAKGTGSNGVRGRQGEERTF